jgi:hypothetical protein
MIVGERSLPVAIPFHSPNKQERPRSVRAGNGRRLGLFKLGGLRLAVVAASADTNAIASLDVTDTPSACGASMRRYDFACVNVGKQPGF